MSAKKYDEPITPVQSELKWRRVKRLVTLAVILIIIAGYLYYRYSPDRPVTYSNIQEHFKYGSIGSDIENGLPWRVLKVLPRMFQEYLPPGGATDYTAFGFIMEPGRETPIGFSTRRRIVDLIGLNCAACHTGQVREDETAEPRIYIGMPSNTVDLQGFFNFLFACAADNRFTAANILSEMEKDGNIFFTDRLIYENGIPQLQAGLLKRKAQLDRFLLPDHAMFGPGRVDTFNPYKGNQFADEYDNSSIPDAERFGTVDFPSIWNQEMRAKAEMNLHWDGNNSSVRERNFSAAFGAGASPENVDIQSLNKIADWLATLPSPPYPFVKINDPQVVARGEQTYQQYCADCHSVGGKYIGTVIPLQEIGTDENRLNSYTEKFVALQLGFGKGYEWQFTHFKKTDGYACAPLDGVWARAPYLHNGSVPSLWDLLTPDDRRNHGQTSFYTGHGVYDIINVGFLPDVSEIDGRRSFNFVITDRGNSNKGHSGKRYGTELSIYDKWALIEYLKTL